MTDSLASNHRNDGSISGHFSLQIPHVRLGEFDMGGVLYHANYFHLFEQGREALLEHVGVPYPSLVADGIHLAITRCEQSFLAPVLYGQSLRLDIDVVRLGNAGVTFSYKLYDSQSNALLHQASTRHAAVSTENGNVNVIRLPTSLRTALGHLGASE